MVICFKESSFPVRSPVWLNEEVYAQATAALIFMCVDMVVVDKDPNRKTIFLAKRRRKPMSGTWWFIGGRRQAGEDIVSGAIRCFKREAGLILNPNQLHHLAEFEYQFRDREQKPQDVGTHTRADIFVVELSTKERELIRLDPEEYGGEKLCEFARDDLLAATHLPIPLIEAYNLIFNEVRGLSADLRQQPLRF